MIIEAILNLSEIHKDLDRLLKCDFREIQKQFAELKDRYLFPLPSSKEITPKCKLKKISKTPSTLFSTPKLTPKRKLKLTPQKNLSSAKSSKKNSDNQGVDPDNLFGRPLKVNLKDIFQDYISSSDDSKGNS